MDEKPDTVVTQHKKNFEQLIRAVKNKDVCLVACKLAATNEDVAVICAVQRGSDPKNPIEMVPFAMFFNGNPYELLKSPMQIDEENERANQKTETPEFRPAPGA